MTFSTQSTATWDRIPALGELLPTSRTPCRRDRRRSGRVRRNSEASIEMLFIDDAMRGRRVGSILLAHNT